jgi:CHAT domain-containing protein
MNPIFRRCIRDAALIAVLCLCAMQVFAQAADQDFSELVMAYRSFTLQGKREASLEVAQKALALAEARLVINQVEVSAGLLMLADAFAKLGQYIDALPLYQRALGVVEKALGSEHPVAAQSMSKLADTYEALAQYEEALPLRQRALAICEKVHSQDKVETAQCLTHLAITYTALTQYEKALPLEQRVLAIYEMTLGPEHEDTAQSITNLATTYRELGRYGQALPLQQRVLAIYEKTLGPESTEFADSLNNLAGTYRALAQHGKALPLQQRALSISEKTLGPDHADTAMCLNNLANTYLALAQYNEALPLQHRALGIYEKSFGPQHPNTATALSNLANTYSSLAQPDKALPLRQRALEIRENALGSENKDTATSLESVAASYGALLQFDKALPLQQRALAIREKIFGPEHPNTARSLNNLAVTFRALAEHDKALPLQQRALAISETTLGPEHPDTAIRLNNLARIYSALRQYDKALPLQCRALEIREKTLGPWHPDTAESLNSLALTYGALDQYDKALPLLQRALTIMEKVFGEEHPSIAGILNNLAKTFSRTSQHDLVIPFYKSSVNAYQSQRERVSRVGTSELQAYTESVAYTYQNLAALLIEKGRLSEAQLVLDMLKEEEQFEFVRRSATSDPRSTRIGYNATEQVWMSRYRQIAGQLAALGVEELALQKRAKIGLSQEQKERQKVLVADIKVAQQAFNSFLGEMRDGFAHQGPVRTVETEELSQEAMRDQQNLIKGMGRDVVLLRYYVTEDKVGMLLTTAGVPLARSTKINSKELNRQIVQFRRLLRDPKSNPLPIAQALYTLLVAPVAHDLELAGAKTVMLSLDGALRYLPFAALHDGQRYLVQRWNLPMYTSVTKNRLRDDVAPQWQAAGLGVTRALGEFSALPAVKVEMSNIIKTASGGVLPGEVYLDGAFTAQRLQDVSKRNFQLLHVASHFRFSPGTEVNSFLLLGDGQQLTLGDIRTQNYRFDNVDLLTLSACDTGLGGGRDEKGREIEGFGVIAQQQGAKAVLATLWPVADQSTSTLMAEMYRRRQEQHLTKIEALRQAQLSLLAQPRYVHPFYWAPFILMGNWK